VIAVATLAEESRRPDLGARGKLGCGGIRGGKPDDVVIVALVVEPRDPRRVRRTRGRERKKRNETAYQNRGDPVSPGITGGLSFATVAVARGAGAGWTFLHRRPLRLPHLSGRWRYDREFTVWLSRLNGRPQPLSCDTVVPPTRAGRAAARPIGERRTCGTTSDSESGEPVHRHFVGGGCQAQLSLRLL